MANPCVPFNKSIHFSINVLLHVTILFTVISLFFVFFASTVLRTHVEEGLGNVITTNLRSALDNLHEDDQDRIKFLGNTLPIDNLIKYYGKPNEVNTVYNEWLFKYIWLIIVSLVVITLCVIITASALCSKVPLGNIILENVAIFTFVGFVEATFFWFIALKYIPAPPSTMIKSIITGLKKYI